MTNFSRQELARLICTLPATDPTSYQYQQLLTNLEVFGSIASSVDEWVVELKLDEPCTVAAPIIDLAEVMKDSSIPPVEMTQPEPEEVTAPEPEKNVAEEPVEVAENVATYSSSDVRKALGEARKNKGIKISDFLQQTVGCDGFNAVPGDKYGVLMAALEAL